MLNIVCYNKKEIRSIRHVKQIIRQETVKSLNFWKSNLQNALWQKKSIGWLTLNFFSIFDFRLSIFDFRLSIFDCRFSIIDFPVGCRFSILTLTFDFDFDSRFLIRFPISSSIFDFDFHFRFKFLFRVRFSISISIL